MKNPHLLPMILGLLAAACTVPNPNRRHLDGGSEPTDPTAKQLTSLVFLASANPGLGADVTAVIDGTTVKASVPFGRNRALVATFTTTGARVEVAGVAQESGVTSNAFLAPVTYHVVAGDGSAQDYTVTAATPVQQAYVKASNTDAGDWFGNSVVVSADGNTLAVGAQQEASAAKGIGGNQDDNSAPASGAVYVFTRSGTTWSQQAYIKASNSNAGDYFGLSVALSADGNTLAVGATGEASAATGIGGNQDDNSAVASGAVYVFTRSGTAWSQQAYIKASNANAGDSFGGTAALSANGDTLAVGAGSESSGAKGINGNQGDNSAPYSGAVYVFTRSGTAWSQQAYVKASNTGANDFFGRVALSADGNTLAVGAYGEDSGAKGVNGNQDDNSASASGAVYVFTRSGATWSQQAYVKASNTNADDGFYTVALSADGNTLAVGAYSEDSSAKGINGNQNDNSASGSGAVYVFARTGSAWNQQAYIKASNSDLGDGFGDSMALSANGTTLAASALSEASAAKGIGGNQDDNSANDSGAIYVFTRSDNAWSQEAYIKASNSEANDWFGYDVTLSADGATLATWSNHESSAGRGVNDNNNQSDNSKPSSGAVYIFH